MIRYFHQPKDYWLDHATLPDWYGLYHRELLETPPADQLVAAYLGYKAPTGASDETAEIPEAMLLPEVEA